MPEIIQPEALADLLRPGMTVYVQGSTGEPTSLIDALALKPELSDGVRYLGCFLPGVNRRDPARLHMRARHTGFFVHGEAAKTFAEGRMRFLPLSYSAIYDYLTRQRVDIAMLQVSPPDADGTCSHGICVDFQPAVLPQAGLVVAEVNRAMPAPPGSLSIPYGRIDYALESECTPLTHPSGEVSPTMARLAKNVAGLVQDGDVIQIGIGRLPTAILNGLRGKNSLGLHGGMISDEVMMLMQAGVLDNKAKTVEPGKAVCGAALGSERLYDWLSDREDVLFRPASYTHDVRVIARIDNFVAINSALEVDLLGQCNAEVVDGRQVSGTGGLMDFVRGARLARGGRSILAVQATAAGGKLSRIVPRLPVEAVVTCPRSDVDIIVTEHGIARLHERSLDERAEALIAIAAPEFRDALTAEWREMRARMRRA